MEQTDVEYLKDKLADVFDKTGLSNEQIMDEISHFDMNISLVAIVNDEIAGFYFLGNDQIPEIKNNESYNELSNLKGVEGIGLGVLKKFKNMGIGKKLIEYSQRIPNVDYIWGYQFKSLKNIDDWLKRRKIYFQNNSFYITYQILKNDK
jgi:GNAT superfamily N-acetyltransferase